MMTIQEIKEFCQQEAMKHWGLIYNCPIRISGKLTNSLGIYKSKKIKSMDEIIPTEIVISQRTVKFFREDNLKKVILHELAHWALSIQGKPYQDGHPTFEREIKRVGAVTTHELKFSGEQYILKCSCCNKVLTKVSSKRMLNKYTAPNRRSTCCKSNVVYDTVMINDVN